jgi:hypothetical protein
MKLTRTQQRVLAYVGGLVVVALGGLLTKYVDTTAGVAVTGAGGMLLGALREQILPPPHRRKGDPVGVTVPPREDDKPETD